MIEGQPQPLEQFAAHFQTLDTLNINLDDIPDPNKCFSCDRPTAKAMVSYTYDITEHLPGWDHKFRIVVEKLLPGYECEEEDLKYYDMSTSDKFLEIIAEGLSELGYDYLKEHIRLNNLDPTTWATFSPIPEAVRETFEKEHPNS